jgi:hypothetical protein
MARVDDLKLLVGGPHVWSPPSVSREPGTQVVNWTIMKVMSEHYGEETFHVIGFTGSEGRVSSKIKSFDREKRVAITNSGRRYVLIGESGNNRDALYVWGQWCKINGVTKQYEIGSHNFHEMPDI